MQSKSTILSKLFDTLAERNPKGLVARFRKRFGKLSAADLDRLADEAEKAARDVRKRGKS